METLLEHPDLPFSIELNPLNNQYIKRYANGSAQSASETDYLLALIFIKLSPNIEDFVPGQLIELEGESIEEAKNEILEAVKRLENQIKSPKTGK